MATGRESAPPVSIFALAVSIFALPVSIFAPPVSIFASPISIFPSPVSSFSFPVSMVALPVSINPLNDPYPDLADLADLAERRSGIEGGGEEGLRTRAEHERTPGGGTYSLVWPCQTSGHLKRGPAR